MATAPVPIEAQPHQQGHKVWPVAYEVYPDEKALLLIERDENAPGFRGFRRYQTIFVARKDELAKYMEDMGPAELFLASALDVPGGDPGKPLGDWWETVGSLRDCADDLRALLAERQLRRQVPDLLRGYHDLIDEQTRERKVLSQFGPIYKVQRG